MWIGDIFKKIIANLITFGIIAGVAYFLIIRYVF